MRFDKFIPADSLKPYIRYFVISETERQTQYKVFPSAGLVIGFQYRGELSLVKDEKENRLATAGITGISDAYKVFKNSAHIGTVLVFFSETGFIHFASHPANELFNQSLSLDQIFSKSDIAVVEEKLAAARTDIRRIGIVERFLLTQLKDIQADRLIVEAVKRIYQSGGTIRIKALQEQLFISQSPFEKRFRQVVGTTPKKFASIVRFHAVLDQLHRTKSLTEICYENHFFDQAHFIKDFRQFTGNTPDDFKRSH